VHTAVRISPALLAQVVDGQWVDACQSVASTDQQA